MARRDTLQEQLAAVSALDLQTPEGRKALKKALGGRSCHVVARAAQRAGQARLEGLDSAINKALDRFYRKPVRTDPGCGAKLALLTALDHLDHPDPAPFFRAAAHIQLEPAWGPPVDTAVALRARAILAIGRSATDEALVVLGSGLADPESPVRRAAVEALLSRGDTASAALLAMRVRFDDDDPVARAECMSALVRLAPTYGLRFLTPMLHGDDNTARELAAMALGESRHPQALHELIGWLDRTILSPQRAVGIGAIGAHRSEAAQEFLLELVEEGTTTDARQAIDALIRQGTPVQTIRDAAAERPELSEAITAAAGGR